MCVCVCVCVKVIAGDAVTVMVNLRRETGEDDEEEKDDSLLSCDRVVSQRFPEVKGESWWLVVGDANTNAILSIKRTTLRKSAQVSFHFFLYLIISNNLFPL